MPRRKGDRCPARVGGFELTKETEWLFIHGGFGGEPFERFEMAWHEHRDTYLPRWVELMPGCRPWVCYIVGEIDPLPFVRQPGESARRHRIGGREWFGDFLYGKNGRPEIDALFDRGIITADEAKRGEARVAKHGATLDPWKWVT